MRNKFDEQLEALHIELIKMGCLCETAIANASKSLQNANEDILNNIAEIENDIDQKERDIEGLCMKLLLQQQPSNRSKDSFSRNENGFRHGAYRRSSIRYC